jgi:hypothetical protein
MWGKGDEMKRAAKGLAPLGLALALLVLLAGCATVEIRDARVVAGTVTDESGQPVASSPIVVVARSLDLAPTRMEYEERGRQEARATTDAEGHYRLEFIPATLGNNFYLFFYDKSGFDGVKYRRPGPLDITELLNRDRTVIVNQVLRYAATWPEVERQIAFYGANSDRGKILRKNGLPDRREPAGTGDPDSEVWWYDAYGISYWFTGNTLASTHTFQPIPGAAPR